ncbi:MAG TPA: flippase [Acidobacteriota bacterium]|nr:flippase [Acidobacteriota bacterium]
MGIVAQLKGELKDEKKKRLLENYFSLSLLQGVNYLLPLVTLPYLVRVLGAEKYGLVMFANAFIQYFVILTDFGFNISATREIAVHREDQQKISEIFCSVIILKTCFLVVALGLMSLFVFSFAKFRGDWLLYVLTFGIVLGQTYFPVWFFQGMEKMKFITLLNITARLIFTISIFLLVRSRDDYVLVPLLNSAGLVVAAVLGLWIAVRHFHVSAMIPRLSVLIGYVRQSFQFFLSRVSVSIYTVSNTFVLGLFTSTQTVAYYAAAAQLYKAVQNLFLPLSTALYPFISKERNVRLYRKIFGVALGAVVCISVLAFSFSGPITGFIFGSGFEETSGLLKLFSLLIIIVVASILIGYPFLAALGHARYANFSVVVGSIVHLLLLAAIIPVINAYLVVVVTIVTESIVLAVRVYGVRKQRLWNLA